MESPETSRVTGTKTAPTPEVPADGDEGAAPGDQERDSVGRWHVSPGPIRNLITAVVAGAVILGLIWYFDRPESALGSQAVRVTASANAPAPRIGKEVADFQVLGVDGNSYRLSDFRGRPVWLNFWATWCPPCRAENPDIQAVYDANKDQGLVVLAISLGEDPDTVRGYANRTHLNYPMGIDQTTEIAALYRIVGIPTHFFIDRDGILREIRIGGLSKGVMEKKVRELMATETASK
jgi:peroxiredoxin